MSPLKLQSVAAAVQRKPTPCSALVATLCRVTEIWGQFANQWERLRWARMRAGYGRAKDAADSLGIKPVTYRTYEVGKGDGGRAPSLTELQRIARKFKVNWIWLATGEGSPDEGITPDERMNALAQKMGQVPAEKQDDALAAIMGVLDALTRKAG